MDYCNYWLSFDFTEKKRTKNIYEVSSIILNLVFHLMSFSDFFPSYKSVRVLFFILLSFLFAWVLTHNHKNDASKLVLLGLRFSKKQPKKRRDIFWTKNEKKKCNFASKQSFAFRGFPTDWDLTANGRHKNFSLSFTRARLIAYGLSLLHRILAKERGRERGRERKRDQFVKVVLHSERELSRKESYARKVCSIQVFFCCSFFEFSLISWNKVMLFPRPSKIN